MKRRPGYENAAHLYDLFDTKNNVDFFLHYALEAGKILDVGAGTGRIAIPIAEKGIKVTCIEPSPAMRREFSKKLSGKPEISNNIELIAADAASFDLGRSWPAAFLSGTFDHFLDDQERMQSLTNIHRHLKPGGIAVFDAFLGLMKDSPLSPAGKQTKGDIEYRRLVGSRVLPDRKVEVTLVFETYIRGRLTERIEEHSLAAVITRPEIHELLKKSSFVIEKEYSNYDFTEYRTGDDLLLVQANKRAAH
jgi:SAM-dependent methyltransferase